MAKLIDLTGQRFGRLTVIGRGTSYVYPESFTSKRKRRNKLTRWICRCDCGNTKEVTSYALRNGRTRSCGCLLSETSREKMNRYWREKKGDRD